MTAPFQISDQAGLKAELEMYRISPENKNCSFLFIEGEGDEKFWQSRIAENSACIVFLYSFIDNNKRRTGKSEVIKNIQTLNQTNLKGFLGIVDDDFDTVFKIKSEKNICVTETHDLETLLLSSPFVFKKLLSEFGDYQLISKFERHHQKATQDYLLDLTLPFAQLEWLKQHLQPSLKLKNLHKDNTILIPDTWNLKQDKLNSVAQQKNIDMTAPESQQLLQKLNNINPWLLCNGHTMIDILSTGFQKGAIGSNKTATSDNISSYIRGAIDERNLYQTELCQSIFNWQNRNTPYQVLTV